MRFPVNDPSVHEDKNVRQMVAHCPSVLNHVDLTAGPYQVFDQIAKFVISRQNVVDDSLVDCVFEYFNIMADGDVESRNLLVVSVFESMVDAQDYAETARRRLIGNARVLFERVFEGWPEPTP